MELWFFIVWKVDTTSNGYDPFAPNQRSPASISFFVNSPSFALKIPPSSSSSSARFGFKLRLIFEDGEELGGQGFSGGRGGEGNKKGGGGDVKGDEEGEGESKDMKKKVATMSMP